MLDAAATADALDHVRFFVQTVGRHHDGDRLADGLVGGVPINLLGALVPALNHAIEILGNDGVFAGFHDGPQLG